MIVHTSEYMNLSKYGYSEILCAILHKTYITYIDKWFIYGKEGAILYIFEVNLD